MTFIDKNKLMAYWLYVELVMYWEKENKFLIKKKNNNKHTKLITLNVFVLFIEKMEFKKMVKNWFLA